MRIARRGDCARGLHSKTFVMTENRPSNPHPENDPRLPNPGDPGPVMPEPRTPLDPFENDSIPPQRPIPHG